MKRVYKILVMVLVVMLSTLGISLASNTAPTLTPNKKSGSVVEPGERIRMVIQAAPDTAIKACTYSWNGKETKNLFDRDELKGKEYLLNKITCDFETFPNTPGEYDLKVTVEDENGLSSKETFTYIVKKSAAPTITSDVANNATVEAGSRVTIVVEADCRLTSVVYSWNGGQKQNALQGDENYYKCTFKMENFPKVNDTFVLDITAQDEQGNKVSETFKYKVKYEDLTAPVIKMSKESGSVVAGGTKLTMTITDDESKVTTLRYNWEGSSERDLIPSVKEPANECRVTLPAVGTQAGTYRLHVTAINSVGKQVKGTYTYIVKDSNEGSDNSDETAPEVTASPSSGEIEPLSLIKLTAKDNEALKTLVYDWDDGDETSKSISGTQDIVNVVAPKTTGTHRLNVIVKDAEGNKTSRTFKYTVDNDVEEEYPTVDADPDGGTVEFGDKITISAEDEDGEIEYVEYYWDNDEDDTTKKYKDEFTVKVPSEEGKHSLYVRAMDDDYNLCDYEKFIYYVEENKYPGNSDVIGDINPRVRELRVEIRNADDKIRFEPEEEILYYVDYYNGTSSKVTNVKVVVDLPTYLKATKASDDGKISSKQVTWNIGTLKAGESERLSFVAYYTSDKVNEKIITVPAKIYSGSSLKDTSNVRNMIFCVGASGTGNHQAYCVGYPDGSFLPEGKISRAELASMISNIEGINSVHKGQFTDANNHWAANYMQAVVDRGYMKPRSYNYFGAEEDATRADIAYAIAAILDVHELEPIHISATDTKNSEARCAIEQLLRLGIMDGYSDGTARPNNNVTRAEAVTIINNYLFRGELYTKGYNYAYNFETQYSHGGNKYILRFTDLNSGHWAYGHIMEATNHHRYERVMDGNEDMI